MVQSIGNLDGVLLVDASGVEGPESLSNI